MTLAELRQVLERTAVELPAAELPDLIGVLAATQAKVMARLTAPFLAPAPMADELVDADTLADEFGVPATWFRERARQNTLPHRRIGRYVRFRRADVRAALEADHRMGTPDGAEKPSNGAAALPRRYRRTRRLPTQSAPEPRHG